MKIKLEQLVASNQALGNLFNSDIPSQISFKLGRIIKQVQENLQTFDETRTKLLQKYGKQQKDGTYKIADKDAETIEKELKTLLDTEVEINAEVFSVESLGEDFKIKPIEASTLDWLVIVE